MASAIAAAVALAVPAGPAAASPDGSEAYDPRLPRVVLEAPARPSEAGGADQAQPAAPLPTATLGAPARPATPPQSEPDAEAPAAADAPRPGFDIADPGMPAWRLHARPFRDPEGRPRIAVVVAGLGLSEAMTDAAIEGLPPGVTLAVAAHAADPAAVLAAARGDGHEVLLTLPMEPLAYPQNDPGPDTLLTSLPPRHNLQRLEGLLSRADGYVGVISEEGSRFVTSPEAMRPVLRRLAEGGLLFVEQPESDRSAAGRVGLELGLPYAAGDRVFDAALAPDLIELQLLELEHLARNRGRAVAIAEPTPLLIDRLAGWAESLADKGLVLAPITAVAAAEPAR